MKLTSLLLALCIATLAHAQPASKAPPAAEKPKVYALVAAMGNKFTFVHEVKSTGTNLAPFKRDSVEVGNNELNRLTLRGLDESIAKTDPGSERVLIAMLPLGVRRDALEGPALEEWIVDELRKMPERAAWDRILVAVPGFRAMARERLPSRLRGMGIFAQPLCQSNPESCDTNTAPLTGVDAVTPEGEKIKANFFVAPYSLVEIIIIDPRTMSIIDRGESVQHTKMYDPKSDSLDVFKNVEAKVMAERIVALVQTSVAAAVADAEGRGTVDVRMRKEVKPGEK